jgi:glycosyltransferase involved in cell wall biosynthesis
MGFFNWIKKDKNEIYSEKWIEHYFKVYLPRTKNQKYSEFMKKLTFHVAPHLQAIESVVIPNAMDLSTFNTNKHESASKTIAMLGYASMAKDPLWALEVVEELNKIQPGWKLILAGADFSQTKKPSEISYGIEFMKRLASLGDQIELIPFQIDVKEFLQGAGVILSSSVRESFHIAVAEGAASGCLPVVRNWPFFQEFDGARSIYPKDWVVESPRSAAERIVANSELTISQRDDIRREIVSMYDWSSVKKKYHDAIWS